MSPVAEFFGYLLKFAAFLGEILFILICLAPLLLGALLALIWFIVGPHEQSRGARRGLGSFLPGLLLGLLLGHWFGDDSE